MLQLFRIISPDFNSVGNPTSRILLKTSQGCLVTVTRTMSRELVCKDFKEKSIFEKMNL